MLRAALGPAPLRLRHEGHEGRLDGGEELEAEAPRPGRGPARSQGNHGSSAQILVSGNHEILRENPQHTGYTSLHFL